MGPGRKIGLDPNGRNTKQVVLKDLSDVLPKIYTYLHRWVVTLVSVRTVSLYSHLFTPPRALGGGWGGVNPSSPIPILQVCRRLQKTGGFFVKYVKILVSILTE